MSRYLRDPGLGVIGNCEVATPVDSDAGPREFRGFERPLERRTRLGLLSDDMDPATGIWWSPFPQTFSPVGIIDSAIRGSRSREDAP